MRKTLNDHVTYFKRLINNILFISKLATKDTIFSIRYALLLTMEIIKMISFFLFQKFFIKFYEWKLRDLSAEEVRPSPFSLIPKVTATGIEPRIT